MALKMSELVKLTDTSKSTILFYVKEGLLPQPQKPKPNLHLYNESCIETIKFIKYLQSHFGFSINEIKSITQSGKFDFQRGFESVLETLDVIMGSAHQSTFTSEYLCKQYNITADKLNDYVKHGMLFKHDAVYTKKELEILEILLKLELVGIETELLQAYVKYARELSALEVSCARRFLASKKHNNDAVKALFDTTLILKPYLFNMHTLNAYKTAQDKS